jgi:hypothetical protein
MKTMPAFNGGGSPSFGRSYRDRIAILADSMTEIAPMTVQEAQGVLTRMPANMFAELERMVLVGGIDMKQALRELSIRIPIKPSLTTKVTKIPSKRTREWIDSAEET